MLSSLLRAALCVTLWRPIKAETNTSQQCTTSTTTLDPYGNNHTVILCEGGVECPHYIVPSFTLFSKVRDGSAYDVEKILEDAACRSPEFLEDMLGIVENGQTVLTDAATRGYASIVKAIVDHMDESSPLLDYKDLSHMDVKKGAVGRGGFVPSNLSGPAAAETLIVTSHISGLNYTAAVQLMPRIATSPATRGPPDETLYANGTTNAVTPPISGSSGLVSNDASSGPSAGPVTRRLAADWKYHAGFLTGATGIRVESASMTIEEAKVHCESMASNCVGFTWKGPYDVGFVGRTQIWFMTDWIFEEHPDWNSYMNVAPAQETVATLLEDALEARFVAISGMASSQVGIAMEGTAKGLDLTVQITSSGGVLTPVVPSDLDLATLIRGIKGMEDARTPGDVITAGAPDTFRVFAGSTIPEAVDPEVFERYTSVPRRPTALIIAVRSGALEVVKAIVARKPDVNATDSEGRSALWWAAQQNLPEICRVLLEARADPENTYFKTLRTPMVMALLYQNVRLVKMLAEFNARTDILKDRIGDYKEFFVEAEPGDCFGDCREMFVYWTGLTVGDVIPKDMKRFLENLQNSSSASDV